MYVTDTLSRAPQHGQSDACETNFFEELEDIKHAEDVNMKDTTLDRIRSIYEDDAIARLLKTTIIQGWPESRSQLPNSIKVFFAHHDEYQGCTMLLAFGKAHPSFCGFEHSWHGVT